MDPLDLNKDQWQQLKLLLTQALKLRSADRVAFFDRELPSDGVLRAHALDMLRYYDRATKPFDVVDGKIIDSTGDGSNGQERLSPTVGESIGHYKIRRKLGEGGMGVVYLAEDERLGRLVALKFLSPSLTGLIADRKGQLLAESRSAAILNHPAIVTLHDVFEVHGELVTVMEYVEGRPLNELIAGEPLPIGFALRMAGQLADALAYAHGRGIIHCDLKPANIHVLPGGAPKILDFGLARAIARPVGQQDPSDGRLFGTLGYLAPERLLGREPTAAADVYALGVVLYQLLTGTLPFRTDDEAQLFLDTITATPLPPSMLVAGIPTEVDDLSIRCLAKNPRERLQPHELLRALNAVLLQLETAPLTIGPPGSTRTIVPNDNQDRRIIDSARPHAAGDAIGAGEPTDRAAAAIVNSVVRRRREVSIAIGIAILVVVIAFVVGSRWPTPTALHDVRTIAVLPFAATDAQAATDRSAMAGVLARDVANILQGMSVTVKGLDLPPEMQQLTAAALRARLNVDAVIHGSLHFNAGNVILQVGALKANDTRDAWSETYQVSDNLAPSLPRLVATDISRLIGRSEPETVPNQKSPVSFVAYDHYARGRQLWEARDESSLMRSAQQFEEAIKLSPDYAAAWSGLADVYISLGVPAFGPLRPFDSRGRAREAAMKALDLDPDLADAHASLAFLAYFDDWNWTAAEERFQRALRLNPNYAVAHHWYADFLNAMGRFDEATDHIHQAVALEPLSVLFHRDLAWHSFFQRKYTDAIRQLQETLQMDAGYAPAHTLLGRSLIAAGRYAEGLQELEHLDLSNPANQAMLAYGYAAAAEPARARQWLARLTQAEGQQYVSPYSVALVYVALGDESRALTFLSRASEEQDSTLVNVGVDPRFDGIRSRPEFRQLLTRMRFPDTIERARSEPAVDSHRPSP